MAKKDTFLLVSLEEEKAKRLATVIGSEVCRKILDTLAAKEATESELSAELNVPLSTTHYNLKALVDSGLVKSDEFHYSAKGKEVNHYSLANKYIIIAPTEGIATKLKRFLPAAIITAGIGIALQILNNPAAKNTAYKQVMEQSAAVPAAVSQSGGTHIAGWFIAGAIAALLIFLFTEIIGKRFK